MRNCCDTMGKKMGVNAKAAEARQQKEEKKVAQKVAATKKAENDYWDEYANPKAKRDKKKEEQVCVVVIRG